MRKADYKIKLSCDGHDAVIMKNYKWIVNTDGTFELYLNDKLFLQAGAVAYTKSGEKIDSQKAELVETTQDGENYTVTFKAKNSLILTQKLSIKDSRPYAKCILSKENGEEVETNKLIPLNCKDTKKVKLWTSLWTKMILVPYDNTMWLRYEAVPLRAGRKSYDLTVVFSEKTKEAILIAATEFTVWKNAVMCSGSDAAAVKAISGVADEGTHDMLPHGYVKAKEVASDEFVITSGNDYQALLEEYGDIINKKHNPVKWDGGVPFGWNSWSGIAFRLNEYNYDTAGDFLYEELMPKSFKNKTTYVNLDALWNCISPEKLVELVDKYHARGQKAGIYDGPFTFHFNERPMELPEGLPGGVLELLKNTPQTPIPGANEYIFDDILLKDENGEYLEKVDGSVPMDVTHPAWKAYTKWKFDRFVEWGFDYVKVDFLSHGGMEASRYNKEAVTGRMALHEGYKFFTDLVNPEKIGRPFFVSLSIAPLFPCGYGHARRFSCDAFGLDEDVEYVLNAQTYTWWQSGRLYHYNDPDHISLYQSFCGSRTSTDGEARARYTAAVIAGSVIMLSEDYGEKGVVIQEARDRALKFATNEHINKIGASGVSFRPISTAGTTGVKVFYADIDGTKYIAVFGTEKETVSFNCEDVKLNGDTSFTELWSGKTYKTTNGSISFDFEECDAIMLRCE